MRSITLFALFCARLAAADMRPEWTVLYGHEEFRKTDTMLQDYLRKAHSAAEADREKVIASVRTPVALRKYQSETAARLRAILGEFPARTPLNPKVAGRLERSGYRVEKLIFESRPSYYVTAKVYVPRGRTGLFPGVISQSNDRHEADSRHYALVTITALVAAECSARVVNFI